MLDTLFADAPAVHRAPLPLLPECGKCGLLSGCRSPKMPLAGTGAKKIMVVGEAPGRNEDEQGEPFVGKSGGLLWDIIDRDDCWIVNAARCRPPKNKLPPRTVDHCRPLTVRDIEGKRPRVVILLGESAVRSVIGWLWRDGDVGGIGQWAGWCVPSQQLNAWVCPTWHPASFLHGDDRDAEVRKVLWERHLRRAVRLAGKRPWKRIPEWSKEAVAEMDVDEAAEAIRLGIDDHQPIAIDLETNCLRPETPGSEIVCCAISNGEATFAYPWHGAAIQATKELVRSGTPLIAANNRFEERWFRAKLGRGAKRWIGDTVLDAHLLDNRGGTANVGWQSFAVLGLGDYYSHVEPYLKTSRTWALNRIRELPLETLLKYNGMDAVVEWNLWRRQRKRIA